MRKDLLKYDKELLIGLIEDAAKLWLAHDGLWFQVVEKVHGLETAIAMDKEAWGFFSPLEAKRIKARLRLPEEGGADALVIALKHRLYSHINVQTVTLANNRTVMLRMNDCRVQSARERKGMPFFPCKEVGIVEYTEFAKAIDPRFKTRCLGCPPDPRHKDYYCAWEFFLEA
jgi:hypothetical protein